MKTQEMDNELKKLIQEIKLDKPGNDFTTSVMNRVFEEKAALEKVKGDSVFGKGFWIILILFILLLTAVVVFSIEGIEISTELPKLFGNAPAGQLQQGYQSFFTNLGGLPLSIGGILFATSLLLFFDKFLHRILPNHSNKKAV